MKKYEDPEMNVVLFNDRTFVNNGVGTSGETQVNYGDGTGNHDIYQGDLEPGEGIG